MKNIVIADDDKAFLTGLAEVLKISDAQYDIFVAEDGAQAEKLLNSLPVDLLITDIRMPVLDGRELMRRAARKKPEMPVIIVSACTDAAMLKEFGAGNYHFFDKPLVLKDLLDRVATILEA